jgi:hypothetical protein
MLDSWGSDLIVGLLAMLFGGTLRVFMLLGPEGRPEPAARRKGESWWAVARRQADEGASVAAAMPASGKLAMFAVYGLLVVIWVSIAISPVEMRWIAFFVGMLAGYVVVELVFRAGKRTGAGGSSSEKRVPT